MATTVAQHSVATFTSPVNGTTPIDANTVRGNDNTTRAAYNDHDADPGIHVQSSSLASRPVAGTAGRKWITEDSGVYTLWFDDGTNWHPVSSENIALTVLAGENLVKGDVVKVTGWNNGQDLPEVVKTTSAADTAFAVITATVSSGSMGYATNTGIVQDVNTAAYSVGTILYANGSGGFTSTKPTSGHYQPVAYVLRSNMNNGVYYVEFSTPRIVERSDNTASTVVLRDASGNFSAGTVSVGALTSTGLVTFASLKGTGATTVTDILNDSTMATASATTLATSASIKTYVDNKVATVDTLAEVLANGNTTGANDIIVNAGQKIRTPAVAAQDGTSAISIANSTGALTLNTALADSNLATISTAGKVSNSATTATSANTASAIVARDGSGNFSAGTITATLNGAAPAGSLSGSTLASGVTASSLTSVGTLTSLAVKNTATANTDLVVAANTNYAARLQFQEGSTARWYMGRGAWTGGNNFELAGSSALFLSMDASGNLAVDTNTLYVDAANNRVGVGTASPGYVLQATAPAGSVAVFQASQTGISNGYQINSNGTALLHEWFNTGSAAMTLDRSGNLGLGVTPSAWSTYKALQVGQIGAFWANPSGTDVYLSANYYFGSGADRYIANGYATHYKQNNGTHAWYTAPSGTAGNAITFTQALTLDASGNLNLGQASSALQSGGTGLTVYGSSASEIKFLNSTSGTSATDGTALVLSSSDFNINNRESGAILFGTANTERARITSGGTFLVGRTTVTSSEMIGVTSANADFIGRWANTNANPAGLLIGYPNASPNSTFFEFLYCSDSTAERFVVRSNGGIANYSANNVNLSDLRVKKDITPVATYWDKLKAIEVVTFKYKDQTHDDLNVGVIAQQVESVAPEFVDADGFDKTPADGVPLKAIYNTDLQFAALRALQEAMARIETLEQRVLALEA